MNRVSCGIAYDGVGYIGWQVQPNGLSLQHVIETALSKVANQAITIFCAGRTDKGVHAVCQVVHFDTQAQRSETDWVRGTTTYLKETKIRLLWAIVVPSDFHARFSASARSYLYLIDTRTISPTHTKDLVLWHPQKLNVETMNQAAQYCIGKHDFSFFRAIGCQAKSPVKTVSRMVVVEHERYVLLFIKANSFLYHMVRYLVHMLLEIGMNKQPVELMAEALAAPQMTPAIHKKLAKPHGLYLYGIDYHDGFYPEGSAGDHWLVGNDTRLEMILNGR